MKCSASSMRLKVNQCCRFICLTLVLISYCVFGGKNIANNVANQVEATLWPKARICFNSMSTSFQSECVYCDSRLYTSTITTCTGQPFLANNVTQAQAFCIATACLQVPVLTNKAEPYKVANNLFKQSINKLSLSRPSLLFGPEQSRWSHRLSTPSSFLYPISQYRLRSLTADKDLEQDVSNLMGLLKDSTKFRLSLEPAVPESNSDSYQWPDMTSGELLDASPDERGPTGPVPSGQPAEVTTVAPSSTPKGGGGGGGVGGSNSKTTTSSTASPETTTAKRQEQVIPSKSTPAPGNKIEAMEFPNFNQMHAQILHNSLANRRQFLFRKPIQYFVPPKSAAGAVFGQQLQHKLQSTRSPLVELLQMASGNLHTKKQTGKNPVVLGRRRKRRSLGLVRPLSLSLNKNKQKNQVNGTVTANLNKSVNGTTVGNVAFVLNNPAAAYIWSNPLARVLTRKVPNKSIQWQFGRGGAAPAAAAATPAATTARPAASGVIRVGQTSRPIQSAPQLESSNERPTSQVGSSLDDNLAGAGGSFVVPADARRFAAG